MNLIENLSLIAVLGAVNYWFINYFDMIDFFDRDQNDEKYSFWVVLGVINYSVIYILFLTPIKHCNHYFVYLLSVLISFFVNLLLLKLISKAHLKFLKEDKTTISFRTVLVNALDDFDGSKKLCHIFDFEDNLIEHGWLEHYPSNDKDKTIFSLQLDPPNEEDKINIYKKYATFRNKLSKQENVRLVIDFENKLKIFIEFFDS